MMDFGTILRNHVRAARLDRLKTSPQLTLGELIAKLEALPDQEKTVHFDFCSAVPEDFASWRGSYEELMLSYAMDYRQVKVSELLGKARAAVGATFEGYKGGDFTMGRQTPVWVSTYGNSDNTVIVDVIDYEHVVILATAYCEF